SRLRHGPPSCGGRLRRSTRPWAQKLPPPGFADVSVAWDTSFFNFAFHSTTFALFVVYLFYMQIAPKELFYEIDGTGRQQSGQPGLFRHQTADDERRPLYQRDFRVPEHSAE